MPPLDAPANGASTAGPIVTAIGVLGRAWLAESGVTVESILSDNGSCYRSYAWRDACADLGIAHKRSRSYRPQTNGKIEPFYRTVADGWTYARYYDSETARRDELPTCLHFNNHHRAHSAIGAQLPVSRLTYLPGQHRETGVVTPPSRPSRSRRVGRYG
jgi:transposase InsO family protein